MNDDFLLTERQVAELLNVSVAAVRKWRFEKRGPKFVRISRLVRYRPQEIEAFIQSCTPTEHRSGKKEAA